MNNVKIYNKLVRDNIPEIIDVDVKKCDFEMVNGKRKFQLLQKKLQEEVNEFLLNSNVEKLADIMEVVLATAEVLGVSEEDFGKIREEKKDKYGGFKQGILLKSVKKR